MPLPLSVASILLLVAGLWWGLTVVAWITWERRFASPGKRRAIESREVLLEDAGKPEERTRGSLLVDVVEFGMPSVLSIGLALDGLAAGGVVFYASGWSFFLPVSEGFQVLAAVLLFVGLSLFTSGAYLTGKYVYSKLPEERPLLQRGSYRYIRHPIYLAFILTAVGFLLLAQNVVMLPLLIALTAVRYPKVEEQELIRLFGDADLEYRHRTGRFVPKFRRT